MESINRMQTKDYIANMLKKEILYNRMKDGEELVQETVAGKLGVSRMPIREAFQILEFPSARFNPPPLGGQALASFK